MEQMEQVFQSWNKWNKWNKCSKVGTNGTKSLNNPERTAQTYGEKKRTYSATFVRKYVRKFCNSLKINVCCGERGIRTPDTL